MKQFERVQEKALNLVTKFKQERHKGFVFDCPRCGETYETEPPICVKCNCIVFEKREIYGNSME